jgi:hypothetical protein
MRKLGRNRDSLELLLDTVCSMFGAILLIAILVALMAQTARVDHSGEQATTEMLQRKIATAEADLAQAQRAIEQIGAPPASTAGNLAAERKKLEAALAEARAQREKVKTLLQDQVARQTVDFSSEWKKLLAEQRELERRAMELENDIKAQEQNAARLKARAEDIGNSIQQAKEARVVNLRFPKERARTKRALPIICKFGKVYPLIDAQGQKNEATVVWSKKGSGELARPVEALGWNVAENGAGIDQLIASVPKAELYIAFYVYPDSFDAFHAVREKVIAAQIDFGLEMDRAGSDLFWGSSGTSPPPL